MCLFHFVFSGSPSFLITLIIEQKMIIVSALRVHVSFLQNIDITNFSSSWADGLAFCAVYHTYLPSHIPFSTLSPENKVDEHQSARVPDKKKTKNSSAFCLQKENLSLAFKTGEGVGITQSLVRITSVQHNRSRFLTSLTKVFIRQTIEEMLRAGGPDWQRVLSYVESMYRHFEM